MTRPVDDAGLIEHLCSLRAQGPRFGVDRMRALAAEIGNPQTALPCVHVAGTNGKGSVAAMLEAILRTAGWRVGLSTSPHLVSVGERVQVNRVPLTDARVAEFARELLPVGDRIAGRSPELRPSFFEYMTAIAFLHFARERCDLAVHEVGLGGRLDATNVLTPEVAVITSIGLDHCELLGDTLEEIAAEKAGIIKPGVPVVMGRVPQAAGAVIRRIAAERAAPLLSVQERYGNEVRSQPQTVLEGEYQRWNAATAALTAEALGSRWRADAGVVAKGLAHVTWPGRWQRVSLGDRTLILDASHNPEGAEALGKNLAHGIRPGGKAPIVVVGVLGGGRARPLLEVICRHARAVHLVVPQEPRACGHEELQALVPAGFAGKVVRDTLDRAFPEPGRCAVGDPGDVVVVTGSIYLLGAVMRRLGI